MRRHGETDQPTTAVVKSDTVTIHDTLTVSLPRFTDSRRLGYLPATLPIFRTQKHQSGQTREPRTAEDSTEPEDEDDSDTNTDPDPDSATCLIPMEQRHYRGGNYEAWVSGYHPQLDSLRIDTRQQIITQTQTVTVTKTRRWGLSIGVGAVASPKGIEPGIFIGASYTFLAF